MTNNLPGAGFLFRETLLLDGDGDRIASETRRSFSRERVERTAACDERERLGREVHDGPLQALTGVALQLAALRSLIGRDPRAAVALVHDLEELVRGEQRALRAWVERDARKASGITILGADLVKALRALCRRAESQWGLDIQCGGVSQDAVPQLLADHVYRIVQEAVANAGKHARASHLRVVVHTTP